MEMRKGLLNLFKIKDTPQRIALGLGIGVFSGIIPGTGPIAALFLAWIFRANFLSALLGSSVTNTWLSIVMFLLSVRVGSAIMQINWQETRQVWIVFIKDFHWSNILKLPILKTILPVIVGYLVVAFCLGVISYFIILTIFSRRGYKTRDED